MKNLINKMTIIMMVSMLSLSAFSMENHDINCAAQAGDSRETSEALESSPNTNSETTEATGVGN